METQASGANGVDRTEVRNLLITPTEQVSHGIQRPGWQTVTHSDQTT